MLITKRTYKKNTILEALASSIPLEAFLARIFSSKAENN